MYKDLIIEYVLFLFVFKDEQARNLMSPQITRPWFYTNFELKRVISLRMGCNKLIQSRTGLDKIPPFQYESIVLTSKIGGILSAKGKKLSAQTPQLSGGRGLLF